MTHKIYMAVLATFLLISQANAQSSRWVEVGGNGELTAYVDSQSIRRTGPKVKVWLKWVNANPVETDTIFPKKKYISAKTLNVYHCADRTLAGLQSIRYANADASGEVVKSMSVSEAKAEYTDLAPETIGESILVYVCKASSGSKK